MFGVITKHAHLHYRLATIRAKELKNVGSN